MRKPRVKQTIVRMRILALVAGALLVSAQAPPSDNPVVAHYRVYRAALERNDLAAAEAAADAALRASVARDGQGGRTAILAVNLAKVRLQRGRTAEAYEPALLAFQIASASPAAGIDPLAAQLVLGRAELTETHAREGQDRLVAGIAVAETRPDMHAEGYAAAADLGRWALAEEEFRTAIDAWMVAARLVEGAEGDKDFARAEARLGEGVARFLRATSARGHERRRPTDTRIVFDAKQEFELANARFAEVQTLMRGPAHVQPAGNGLSLSQQMYAASMAWGMVLYAYADSFDRSLRPAAPAGGGACSVGLDTTPEPNFPAGARTLNSVGAVALRVLTNERSEMTDIRVVAAVPQRWFQEEVERVAPRWRLTSACPGQDVSFTTMYFYFRP